MHRTLAKAFAPVGSEPAAGKAALEAARLLFRVDPGETSEEVQVLVQSRTRPVWDGLTVTTGYLRRSPDIVSFSPLLPVGTDLAFRLRANPTVKRAGKRRALRDAGERIAWLERKADAGGFAVLSVRAADERAVRAGTAGGPGLGEFTACRFEGVLRVRSSDQFAQTLAAGLGSAKGYGFGLLSVALSRG
jgi:CRISPR system Cascade subunit CasE